ncbi:uncharacterized protein [Gossypium hirsutum]|uniref:Uncharacterized protein n=1 Tax=Gossypium hirsutum TaxID=3635 RepID=A0A1U8K1P6_GOSHI|nr:uncharacterized protein LOC107911110 [Gossypium hirsutum]
MTNYAEALKEFLSKKRRLEEFEIVALTTKCSLFFQDKLSPKLKDLGSFTIPCNIGESYCCKALYDLGSSINMMPTSVFRRLGIGKAKPTTVTLQLVDRSLAYAERKIEDVLAIRCLDEVEDFFAISKKDSLFLEKLEYNDPLEGITSDSPH